MNGVCGSYVEDSLNADSATFERLAEVTLIMFEFNPRVYDNFDFYGIQIRTIKPEECEVTQTHYINNLCYVSMNTQFE